MKTKSLTKSNEVIKARQDILEKLQIFNHIKDRSLGHV